MAERIPARLTPREGRRFAFTVGLAFLVFAGLSYWRGHNLPPKILGGIGVSLLALGVVIPGQLSPVFRAWMGLAHAISLVTTPIFLGLVYFVVITPIALVMRVFGHDPLRRKKRAGGYWVPMTSGGRSDLTRQF